MNIFFLLLGDTEGDEEMGDFLILSPNRLCLLKVKLEQASQSRSYRFEMMAFYLMSNWLSLFLLRLDRVALPATLPR